MDLDPNISHLDEPTIFEAIGACEATISLARQASVQHVASTPMQHATSSDCETFFVDAMSHLWAAREALHASVESLDA